MLRVKKWNNELFVIICSEYLVLRSRLEVSKAPNMVAKVADEI